MHSICATRWPEVPPLSEPMLHLPQTAAHLQNMSMGELLAGLPSEVRVHIFCLALDLPISGALLRDWLSLALVSQNLLKCPPVCCVIEQHHSMLCAPTH